MRPRGKASTAATLVACVLLTGCGQDGARRASHPATSKSPVASTAAPTATPTAEPTTSPTTSPPLTLREARREWHDAIFSTGKELSAKYVWSAWMQDRDKPIAQERGVFGLAPVRTAFERILRDPTAGEDGDEYTVRVRRRGDALYMQMADWGPWDGCWLHLTPDLVAETTGLDLAGSPALPIPVVVALDAVVTGSSDGSVFPDPYVELEARVNAIEAMQFLGVSPGPLLHYRDRLTRVQVPVVVGIGVDERVKGAAAWGEDVAAAVKRAHVRLPAQLRQALPRLSASVEFGNFGKGAEVHFPASRFVLPPGATKQRTCPAMTPLS